MLLGCTAYRHSNSLSHFSTGSFAEYRIGISIVICFRFFMFYSSFRDSDRPVPSYP
jgi:hypothetical protein